MRSRWVFIVLLEVGCAGFVEGEAPRAEGPAMVDAGIDEGVVDCAHFAPIVLSGAFVDPSSSTLEVHNRTSRSIDLTGWTMRVRSVGGFLVAPLAGTVAAGGFRSFTNDGGSADERQPLLALGTSFASIELIGPNGQPCTAEGDAVSWGSVMPICASGPMLSSLPTTSGRVGYRREDPCAESSQRWRSSSEAPRNVDTPLRGCGCP